MQILPWRTRPNSPTSSQCFPKWLHWLRGYGISCYMPPCGWEMGMKSIVQFCTYVWLSSLALHNSSSNCLVLISHRQFGTWILELSEMLVTEQRNPKDAKEATVSDSLNDNLIQEFQWNPWKENPDLPQSYPQLGLKIYSTYNLVEEENDLKLTGYPWNQN